MEPVENFGSLEYRVKPITRYVITRHEISPSGKAGCNSERGQYDNADVAWEVAYALCKMEHERFGYPPGDERVVYPRHPLELPSESVDPLAKAS